MRRQLALLEAPTNLGLRPPKPGAVPGCYKMPWALRNAGLLSAINAVDFGCVIPPQYEPDWEQGETTRNSLAIESYSRKLADRIEQLVQEKYFPVVVGGDCSILLASGLYLKNKGTYGLLFLDGHSDFRHLDNEGKVDAAAGEDLAISLGLGDPRLINISGQGANFTSDNVAVLGIRDYDAHLNELRSKGIFTATSTELIGSFEDNLSKALCVVETQTEGFWIHVDLDVVDAQEMFAADSPEPEGISFEMLSKILQRVLVRPNCVGIHITIYDPDLDPEGICARSIVKCLKSAVSG